MSSTKRRTRNDLLNYDGIIIYGAGNYLQEMLLSIPKSKVVAIVDGNTSKIGKQIYDNMIIESPNILNTYGSQYAIVLGMVSHAYEVYKMLVDEFGIDGDRIFTMQRPFLDAMFKYDVLDSNMDKIYNVYDILDDDESKTFYKNFIDYINFMSPNYLSGNNRITQKYYYQCLNGNAISVCKKLHIVDCGAYIGDSAEFFLDKMDPSGNIICIEGFIDNCIKIKEWIQENNLGNRISLFEGCVGNCEKEVKMSVGGILNDSALINDSVNNLNTSLVRMSTLDQIIGGNLVDFIKFDIEGAEMDALHGGRGVIAMNKPQMIVSAYHKLEHLWEIPLFLKEIVPEYKVYFGHQPYAAMEPEFYITE